jgi:transketolase
MSPAELDELQRTANALRLDVVRMVHEAGDGHPGPCLSIADIVAALYFRVLRVNPQDPRWPERDRLILSKGHACPVVYAALARRGYFPRSALPTLRSIDSILQGHPDMKKTPGVDMTAGSLGHGVAQGLGIALAGRLAGLAYHVYVILGDGELGEGICWESFLAAAHHQASNLIAFVDCNGLQSGGTVGEITGLEPLPAKLEAFGWYCQEIDGHDIGQILRAVESAKAQRTRPSAIVARTVKGKGVPYMERDNAWHKKVPTREQVALAAQALGGSDDDR